MSMDTKSRLFSAAQNGDMRAIKTLRKEGVDLNMRSETGDTALLYAALNGHTEVVRYLIGNKLVDIDAQNKFNNTALHLAIAAGKTETAILLIMLGADCELKNDAGDTPMILAAHKQDILVSEALIEQNVNLDARNNNDDSALVFSISNEDVQLTQMLIDGGADYDDLSDGMQRACDLLLPYDIDEPYALCYDEDEKAFDEDTVEEYVGDVDGVPRVLYINFRDQVIYEYYGEEKGTEFNFADLGEDVHENIANAYKWLQSTGREVEGFDLSKYDTAVVELEAPDTDSQAPIRSFDDLNRKKR